MAPTRLSPDAPTREAFFALATERARLRDPGFPAADPSRLERTSVWFAGWTWRSDQRGPDGIGWVLDVDERDTGPAEVIHEDTWTATAYGAGWTLRVHRLASGSDPTQLTEEDGPATPTGSPS